MKQKKDREIPGMLITINTTGSYMNMPDCMTAEEIKAKLHNKHLSILSELVLLYSSRDDIATIDRSDMKGKIIITIKILIIASLQDKALK